MNSVERVRALFEEKSPDVFPVHHIGFSSDAASHILGREAFVGGGIQRWREACALWEGEEAHKEFLKRSYEDAVELALKCGSDILRVSYWRFERRPTKRLDENAFLCASGQERDWVVLRYDPPSEQCAVLPYVDSTRTVDDLGRELEDAERSLEGYDPERAFEFELRAQWELGSEKVIRAGGVGIGVPHESRWLEALILRPGLVERKLELQLRRARRTIDALVPLGFRYFFGGGDFCSNAGPMYSPEHFRAFVAPRLRAVSEACHARGAHHLFASDGNLWPVAEDIFVDGGADGFYEIDRRAGMDLRRLHERFPGLVLVGNVSSHTVHTGRPEEVREEVLDCARVAAETGKVVVGVSNYFVPGTPARNVRSVLDAIEETRGGKE